ncbi:MAG: sigma factor-like helix-turn-helix DNA-binding protein [Nitriliruptor sp.]
MSTPSASDRQRGGPRSGGDASRGGAPRGEAGQGRGGGGGKGSKGGAGRGGGKGGRPPRRSASGENETVAQLTGPLQKVLARLPATQRKVLELRMGLADGHPHDLADTARELGLSLSEARDIEQRAFGYIRDAVPLEQLQRFMPRS